MGLSLFLSIWIVITDIAQGTNEPNILFILFDDLGWSDLSVDGGKYPTTNIDNLFNTGIKLNNHYSHLVCSVSRSQYLTGRYAMYSGQGVVDILDPYSIGGPPIGLPTIANYLKEYTNMNTYFIGKWHMGYAIDELTPTHRGFDHFFGFYSGMLSYTSFQSVLDVNQYDIHEDDINYDYEQLLLSGLLTKNKHEQNALYLYKNQVLKYMQHEIEDNNSWFIYLAMQSPHGPLATISQYEKQCNDILKDIVTDDIQHRNKYCQVMLLSDAIIGEIIQFLKTNKQYDNTLIILATDNGGALENTGCNYPFRGTKGTQFEGNTHTIALVSGGIIPMDQYGTIRQSLFSSLDWLPTLLDFANINTDTIDEKDKTWDGISQYDLIMNGDNYLRDHIVLNIGKRNMDSATIVFRYPNDNNKIYKYIAADRSIEPRQFAKQTARQWCVPSVNNEYFITDSKQELGNNPDAYNDKYWLFNLDIDPSEINNLLINNENDIDIDNVLLYAKSLLQPYIKNKLYSEHIGKLFTTLEIDGIHENLYVDTFLTKEEYINYINQYMDIEENENNNPISDELRKLFTQIWEPPKIINVKTESKRFNVKRLGKHRHKISIFTASSNIIEENYQFLLSLILLLFFAAMLVIKCVLNKHTTKKKVEQMDKRLYLKYGLYGTI
eukprot:200083_1